PTYIHTLSLHDALPIYYRLVNVTGSENLYKAAQQAGMRRFVHTSSHTVYGLGHGRFLTENDPLRPDPDPYSLTKAEGDRLIRRLDRKSTRLNSSHVSIS